MRSSVRILSSCCSVVLCLLLPMLAAADELREFNGKTMGTTYHVRFVAGEEVETTALQSAVDRRLEAVNAAMSTWRADSEISRFNAAETTDWFPVSPMTAEVVARALEISRETEGAFDVTVKPLFDIWPFGHRREEIEKAVPTDEAISAARQLVGYEKLEARADPPALRKQHPQLEVDLSAIAKGYGVDVAAAALQDAGCQAFLVEIGGEVRTRGSKPDDTPWQVGIEKPTPHARSLHAVVSLTDDALATSGDYRNHVEIDGKQYSHTIDPRTGRPVTHRLGSVSVVAKDCMTADAYATALMVLGPAAGNEFATAHALPALFLTRDKSVIQQNATPEFGKYLPSNSGTTATTWLLALVVFLAVIAMMSVGVILSNRRIQGSCGGLANLTDEQGNTLCQACRNPSPECLGEPLAAPDTNVSMESAEG